jgi:hypothetical protein
MRRSALHINQVSRSKVKVTVRAHRKTLVWNKTSTCIEGFQYNLAQMFIIVRLSAVHKIQVPVTKVKVTHSVHIFPIDLF